MDPFLINESIGLASVPTLPHSESPSPWTAQSSGNDSSKFAAKAKFSAGTISDFHAGLSARIGETNTFQTSMQSLIIFCRFVISGHADLRFMERMQKEHCTLLGCDTEFTTSNYNVTTTSKKEWGYVVEGAACPPSQCGHGRRILSVSELMALPATTAAGLRECEVVALSLYTGPMVCVESCASRMFAQSHALCRSLLCTTRC